MKTAFYELISSSHTSCYLSPISHNKMLISYFVHFVIALKYWQLLWVFLLSSSNNTGDSIQVKVCCVAKKKFLTARCCRFPLWYREQKKRSEILTSALSGCCLITKGLWWPMCMSGSSYVSACPPGIALASSGLLGVLRGKKFWTFLLCLQKYKYEKKKI
jgi:hypothetical protein